MRIPLDYYRILGVPIQVTDEQISQAYQDRCVQLPRREYSEVAIAARKRLLSLAYEILSDSQERVKYDQQFLVDISLGSSISQESPLSLETEGEEESSPKVFHPWIEIESEQIVGVLLILLELGEYELIISLGHDYLHAPPEKTEGLAPLKIFSKERGDIILTMALANLELGREYWQQQEYEKAAMSANQGLTLLEQEALFPSIQVEIRHELNKLRPYRILGLLALPEEQNRERQQGLGLLQAMLQEREGIEGKGNDHSGLTIDDFLRFIQQLKIYLTVEEQQILFVAEAARPSPVASYLAVYALMAGGLAKNNPALILQAANLLQELSQRQNVSLEQAICALLLGQTESASFALEESQDEELLAFIREQSQGAPDLLPGLCLYGEHWLQTEVFSHFRDLVHRQASLKDYFANGKVQSYLEQLSNVSLGTALEYRQETGVNMAKTMSESNHPLPVRESSRNRRSFSSRSRHRDAQSLKNARGGKAATIAIPDETEVARLRDYGEESVDSGDNSAMVRTSPRLHRPRKHPLNGKHNLSGDQSLRSRSPQSRNKRKLVFKPKPLFLGIVALCTLGVVGLVFKGFQSANSPSSAAEGDTLLISLQQSPIEIPAANAQIILPGGVLTQDGAKEVIQAWLDSKARAFGSNHEIGQLETVLTEPLLSIQRGRAENRKSSKDYTEYKHNLEINSLKNNPKNPDEATVEATVKEKSSYYQNGKLNPKKSTDDNLRIRYELRLQNNRWLIKNSQVIK